MIRSAISKGLMSLFGWKVTAPETDIDKCVICVAPHTSNWDFIVGKVAYTALGRNAHFLIKKEWFVFPFNLLFGWMGGVPVERGSKSNLTEQMAREFQRRKKFQLAITPEGSRSLRTEWKKGFYFIAVKAEVPIALVYLDYGQREVGIFDYFYPTGNIEADMAAIRAKYRHVVARHPEQFAP